MSSEHPTYLIAVNDTHYSWDVAVAPTRAAVVRATDGVHDWVSDDTAPWLYVEGDPDATAARVKEQFLNSAQYDDSAADPEDFVCAEHAHTLDVSTLDGLAHALQIAAEEDIEKDDLNLLIRVLGVGADVTGLRTYGGAEPAITVGVWSWDETRLLVGEGGRDLDIVPRVQ